MELSMDEILGVVQYGISNRCTPQILQDLQLQIRGHRAVRVNSLKFVALKQKRRPIQHSSIPGSKRGSTLYIRTRLHLPVTALLKENSQTSYNQLQSCQPFAEFFVEFLVRGAFGKTVVKVAAVGHSPDSNLKGPVA